MNKQFQKRSICITGCSRGLGKSIAQRFLLENDYEVYAITRNPDLLADIKENHEQYFQIIEADISTEEGREAAYNELKSLDGLDVLIHNAGKLLYKEFTDISQSELLDIYNVNVFSPFLLTQKLFPLFNKTHIINISSVGGVEGSLKFKGLSAYSSSKAALNCLTEMWSEEFKETNNAFNCLALGSVETEMFKEAFPGYTASSTSEEMAEYIFNFAIEAQKVMRGKIISVSKSNP